MWTERGVCSPLSTSESPDRFALNASKGSPLRAGDSPFTPSAFEHFVTGTCIQAGADGGRSEQDLYRLPPASLAARGSLGAFRIRSPLSTPLLFVARGTGFAPIKAMIEQQLTLASDREMVLFWGVTDTNDFYDLEDLTAWAASDPRFWATLTARHDSLGFRAPVGLRFHKGTVYEALVESELDIRLRDAYVAGPSKTVAVVVEVLLKKGVPLEHVLVDSYGI
jgi:NAD(P)H-flavin reductase